MKSDNTRPTFNKPRRYTRLIFQQGRPPVDADFNEAHEIQLQMLRSYAADIIGEHGASDADAFLIKPEPDSTNDGKTPVTDLTIGKGRYYVDGVQCENDGAFPGWRTQPFGVPAADGEIKETISVPVLVYLDVWEHHRTWIEDGVLRDPALGGTDTGTRSRVVWQVRLLAKDALPVNEKKTDLDWKHALELENRRNQGKLRVRFNPGAHSGSDCDVHADARYRGAENQLYRVEIHRPGKALTAKADPNDSKDPDKKNFLDERASAATFKWSRENGSVVARWVKARDCDPADGNVLRIQGPRDEVHGFSAGDWIEITGEMDDLRRRAGVFARIKRAEGDALTLEEPLGEALPAWDKLKNPKVRRWDQRDSGNYFFDRGALVIRETENVRGGTQPVWIPLENGLEIQFKEGEKDPHDYRTGDYWLIPVRIATGDLLWPWRDPSPDADAGADEAQPPHGIEHHYAPLAIVDEISAGGTEKKAAKKAAKKAVSEAGEKPPSLIDLRRVITPGRDDRVVSAKSLLRAIEKPAIAACTPSPARPRGTSKDALCIDSKCNLEIQSGTVNAVILSHRRLLTRLVALHHLDAPWRAADIEQREGRIVRQGNQNEFVKIFRYVTQGSFDAYMWQTLETKCRFIAQVMTGDATVRRAEDVDSAALTYAEVRAIASGNPLAIEKATIDAEVMRLTRLKRQHAESLYQMRFRIKRLGDSAEILELEIANTKEDLKTRVPTLGDQFSMQFRKEAFTDRTKAGRAIIFAAAAMKPFQTTKPIGMIGGFPIAIQKLEDRANVLIQGKNAYTANISETPLGTISSLEHALTHLDQRLIDRAADLSDAVRKQQELAKHLDQPFEYSRNTAPTPRPKNIRRRDADPVRVFVDKDRLARFWFLVAVVVLIGAAVERIHLARTLKERERVVIVDPAGTFFVSPLLQFQEARELHAEQSTVAAIAFLERNPKGFDHPELLKQMFLKQAHEKALAEWSAEEPEFKAKELHQKAEIAKIDFLETRSDGVLTQVTGQLIRSGIFQERAFSEAVPFTLKLKMRRNPNMVENGRFPTAIQDFKYEPIR